MSDAFRHRDAQRRLRVIESVEELAAALDAPFEKWTVFLHPAQKSLVERRVTGPTRVTGSAGTGKTIVALHRAVHLARQSSDTQVLLTTFSQPLADALQQKLTILTEASAGLRSQITVRPIDAAAIDLYSTIHGAPNIASIGTIESPIASALTSALGGGLSREFLTEEWTELVDAWGVDSGDA